jgi:hypothetical protein
MFFLKTLKNPLSCINKVESELLKILKKDIALVVVFERSEIFKIS